MKGTKVASIPHPYGERSRDMAVAREHYSNEKQWHAIRSEKTDRTHIEKDMALGILSEIDRLHPRGKGGTGLDDYPGLRPMRGHVYARRRSLWAEAKAAGLAIPENLDRPSGQRQGLLYDVLAVGLGVTSVKVGDCVVVNACLGRDMGDTLGSDVYDFVADVDYVDRREYETERGKHPDGSTYEWQRRMSDVERISGGMILAVVEES